MEIMVPASQQTQGRFPQAARQGFGGLSCFAAESLMGLS